MPDNLSPLLNVGFGALMAVLIWRAYERVTHQIGNVISDNTAAMTSLKETISQQTRMLERLGETVESIRHRVEALEHQHDRGVQ